jgi:hypothetical protein
MRYEEALRLCMQVTDLLQQTILLLELRQCAELDFKRGEIGQLRGRFGHELLGEGTYN